MQKMKDIKFSALWGLWGVLVGLVVFVIAYWFEQGAFPGYKFMLAPGIFATQFFSEELAFWPKLSIMLFGQYMGISISIYLLRRLLRYRIRNAS